MEKALRILDSGFNVAVLHIAQRLTRGFRVVEVAPQTYDELIRDIEHHGIITVWSDASERTIYGDPEVNFAFRAWHDWCHWRGRHDFSPEGENATAKMQYAHLLTLYGDTPRTRSWQRIVEAEIVGQALHLSEHGAFPWDQYAFIVAYLDAHDNGRNGNARHGDNIR